MTVLERSGSISGNSNNTQGRDGAAGFPTENWSSVVWLYQNKLFPIRTNAPSASQQHKMVGFSPLKCSASHAGWIQSFKLRSGKFFSLFSYQKVHVWVHCLPSTKAWIAELFTLLLQLKIPDLLLVFLMLPQIFYLKTSPPQHKTAKKTLKNSKVSINALIYLGILTYIASHGVASSYLGDLF